MKNPNTRLRTTTWADRRSPELLRYSDSLQVKRWRVLVSANEARKRALRLLGQSEALPFPIPADTGRAP